MINRRLIGLGALVTFACGGQEPALQNTLEVEVTTPASTEETEEAAPERVEVVRVPKKRSSFLRSNRSQICSNRTW